MPSSATTAGSVGVLLLVRTLRESLLVEFRIQTTKLNRNTKPDKTTWLIIIISQCTNHLKGSRKERHPTAHNAQSSNSSGSLRFTIRNQSFDRQDYRRGEIGPDDSSRTSTLVGHVAVRGSQKGLDRSNGTTGWGTSWGNSSVSAFQFRGHARDFPRSVIEGYSVFRSLTFDV